MPASEAGISPSCPREGQATEPAPGSRIHTGWIKERKDIVLLHGGLNHIPTETVVEAQLGSHFPGIAPIKGERTAHGMPGQSSSEVHISIVNLLQQETGNFIAAVPTKKTSGESREVKCSGPVPLNILRIGEIPSLCAELQGVSALHPGDQII